MDMTNEEIRDISVKVVEGFINAKTPLNDGICKQASELELNPEQIKRVVEASNTIAYLKLQKEAQDKTFEFPVASYDAVLGGLCLPEKQASDVIEREFIETEIEGQVKEASETVYQADDQTTGAWLVHETLKNHSELKDLAIEKEMVGYELVKKAAFFAKQEWALEKLSEVAEEDEFIKLAFLIGKGESEVGERLFRDTELNDARELLGLFKKAQEISQLYSQKEALDKKAFETSPQMRLAIKSPGLTATQGLSYGAGHAVGSTVSGGVGLGKKIARGLGHAKIDKLSIVGAALSEPAPASNVWDNLQGSQKRFK
jgi:hypothetical protein